MKPTGEGAASPPRDTAAELEPLLVRLDALCSQFEGTEPSDLGVVVEQLRSALADVRGRDDEFRRQASMFERALAAERGRYQDLFDHAPDAYVVTSELGVIRDVNVAATELFGRRYGELVGQPLTSLFRSEQRRAVREALVRVTTGELDYFEMEVEARTGSRCVEARATAQSRERDQADEIQIRWILRDVTGRRRAEDELRSLTAALETRVAERTQQLADASNRLETVVEEMPVGVLIVAPNRSITLSNRRALELTGQTVDELKDAIHENRWTIRDVDGRELAPAERPIASVLATGTPVIGRRVRLRRPDGEWIVLELSATPVMTGDRLDSVIVTFHDVTAQELRQRAERDFVTNAAHELQTPIAAITSAIEVLQAGAKARRADRDRFLVHIEHAAERLGRLTRALLVLARAQTRDEAPRREIVELAPLLESIAAGLRSSHVELRCEPNVAVIANRALLEQALANLAENALKHAPGPLALHAKRRNGRVLIEVRDGGPGIAPSNKSLVFERFYRADGASGDGFGLGLAIVREAVAALDGELEFESGAAGTTVCIRLPGATIKRR